MKNMRFKIILILASVCYAACGRLPVSKLAADVDELQVAKTELDRELSLIKKIEPHATRMDLSRLMVLKQQILKVKESITTNGMVNTKTFKEYLKLVVSFRYSFSFLKIIQSDETAKVLQELQTINEGISKRIGYDSLDPVTQITATYFEQMRTLMLQLKDGPWIDEDSKKIIEGLIVPIGQVIAAGRAEGDSDSTRALGVPLYWNITKLYPAFNKIMSSHAAYDLVLEIQGLNETYGEFAQVKRSLPK